MKREAKDPTGNLCLRCASVLEPGHLYEIVRECSVFMGGGFVITPLEGPALPRSSE